MKKVFIAVFAVVVLVLVGQLSVFAAPDSLPADATGNSTGLVVVTSPQNQKDSTFNEAYIISGYGKEGTVVTVYVFDRNTNSYKKAFNDMQYVDGNGVSQTVKAASETTIAASGLFMNTITLESGENSILVRAANGDSVQIMKLSVTKYNYTIIDLIKSLTD